MGFYSPGDLAFLTLVYLDVVLLIRFGLFQREEQVPVATITQQVDTKQLTTCPGGYVVVKRMSYGQKMHRTEMSGKMKILSNKASRDALGEVDMMKAEVQRWEFANLIVDHNLEHQIHTYADELCKLGDCSCPTRPLNFKNGEDVDLLQAQIGEEIAAFMDKLNNFEEEDETKNSSGGSSPTSDSTAQPTQKSDSSSAS